MDEPGHHFEWASLLVDFAATAGSQDLDAFARKLYASAIANGLNRATGLAYGAVSRTGLPLDGVSRSWPQTEAVKAAIALDRTHRRAGHEARDRGARRPAVPLAYRPGACRPVGRSHRRARPLPGNGGARLDLLPSGLRADAVSRLHRRPLKRSRSGLGIPQAIAPTLSRAGDVSGFYIDRLDLRIERKGCQRVLAADARLLDAAEGDFDRRQVINVDPAGSGLQLADDAMRAGEVARPPPVQARSLARSTSSSSLNFSTLLLARKSPRALCAWCR